MKTLFVFLSLLATAATGLTAEAVQYLPNGITVTSGTGGAYSITVPSNKNITLGTSGSGSVLVPSLTVTEQTIASGTAPTWNVSSGLNATFTATSAATFTISNLAAGQAGTLAIMQASGSTGYVITFPAGTKQAFGGTNTYTMSGTNVIDVLYFRQSGTRTIIEGVVPGVTP